MAKLATFVETFDVVKSSVWSPWDDDSNKFVSGGALNLRSIPSYAGIGTVAKDWDWTSSSITWVLGTLPTTNGSQIGLYLAGMDREVGFTLEVQSGTYQLFAWNNQGADLQSTLPAGTKYLRLREAGGTVTHESSVDGNSWTTHRTSSTPLNATAVQPSFFSGSVTGQTTGLWAIEGVNTATGVQGSAALSAEGTLGATGKATVGRTGDFTTEGSLALTGGTVTTGGSAAFSAVGTLSATGVFGYAISQDLTASGTLVAVGRPILATAVPDLGAVGTLEAYGVADIVADASLLLRTVWLNDSTNLADHRSFPTLQGLTVTQTREGEVRRYSTGRLRSITKAGTKATVALTLQDLDREDVLWLERLRGTPVALRDDRGRKLYAVFYEVPVVERRFSPRSDVNLSLVEVTRSESV